MISIPLSMQQNLDNLTIVTASEKDLQSVAGIPVQTVPIHGSHVFGIPVRVSSVLPDGVLAIVLQDRGDGMSEIVQTIRYPEPRP